MLRSRNKAKKTEGRGSRAMGLTIYGPNGEARAVLARPAVVLGARRDRVAGHHSVRACPGRSPVHHSFVSADAGDLRPTNPPNRRCGQWSKALVGDEHSTAGQTTGMKYRLGLLSGGDRRVV